MFRLLVLAVGFALSSVAFATSDRARLVVLTDLANEPDDEESLVRLLAYANEFDLEGLIATTSCHLRENPREDILHRTIDAYAQVWTNLVVHASDYPTADHLRSIAASGQPGFGTNSLDVASAGSRLIAAAMKRDDPRPLWVSVWGGPNTLHRALRECRDEMSPEAFETAQKKLRVYAISDQDDSGPAIRKEFPLVTWIVDPSYPYDWRDYWWATWGGISGDVRGVDRAKNLPFVEYVDNVWLKANITDVGPLGACYPPHIWIMEGDTPSFLGLIRNGLGWCESPDYGGWGGRYVWRTFKDEPHPIWTSPEQCEEYYGTWRNGNSIVRWREDYQLDFAARLRWSVSPRYEEANHNPTAVVNGKPGRAVIHLEASPGAAVSLDASGSSDPDGQALTCDWQIYRAASSLKGGSLKTDGEKAVVDLSDVPADATGDLHVILRVRDNGTPSLAAFRRVIVHVTADLPVGAPVFEIDGKTVVAEVDRWERIGGPVALGQGIVETVKAGVVRDFPQARLVCRERRTATGPVRRFRYELEALTPEGFTLTKREGKDNLTYLSADLKAWPQRTEVRLSDFDMMLHCHRPFEYPLKEPAFANALKAVGPILVAGDGCESVLLAYEHGSWSADPFVTFELAPEGKVSVRAVKGNYWRGRKVTPGHPYETIWLQTARVKGDFNRLASVYRDFQLNGIALNPASRRPWIFYNTWASQERDHWWGGSRRFLNLMNETRILDDIDRAAEMGIDVFVLDTGWYEKTGDWRVSRERFPNGLKPVSDRLSAHGMKLGLWFSPSEAAESSLVAMRHPKSVMSRHGEPAGLHSVWETEPSRCHCLVSDYWAAVADELIRCHREFGVTYFKWDAIGQYGCDSPEHAHGDASVPEDERADCQAFEQVRYLVKIVERLASVCPEAIVDFDITELGRSVGLAFLSAGKYFAVNNGTYYPELDVPYDWNNAREWSNVFVRPGPARARVARATLAYDRWIPSTLFLTHYLPDGPRSSQLINLGSLVLGQNGIWGDLASLTEEDRKFFGEGLSAYKRVRDAITAASPVREGSSGASPEVHEKLADDGRGAVVIFGTGGSYEYVTEHPAGKVLWSAGLVSVKSTEDGRARVSYAFPGPSAVIVFFDRP